LTVASDLFAAQGYRATTVKEITSQCHITQAALYLYFPSKAAVLAELTTIAHSHLARKLDQGDAEYRREGDPAKRLSSLVGGFVEFGTEYTVLARVAAWERSALPEPEYSRVSDLRRDVRSRFEEVIIAGINQGQFIVISGFERPAIFLATAIIDMCSGIFGWYDEDFRVPSSALLSGYQEAALALVGAKLELNTQRR